MFYVIEGEEDQIKPNDPNPESNTVRSKQPTQQKEEASEPTAGFLRRKNTCR